MTPDEKAKTLSTASEQRQRVFNRLAIYRTLANNADLSADFVSELNAAQAKVEVAFADFRALEPLEKAHLEDFYSVTFDVLEAVSRAYATLLRADCLTVKPADRIATRRDYVIHTGQEIDLLARSACDGHTGKIWRNEPQRQARIYEPQGAAHRVEITLRGADAAQSLAGLETLTKSQDADFVLTLLYVASVLAPPSPMPPSHYAGGWIDLNDVMEKIGWYPSKVTKEKAADLRAQLWGYLLYGDRAAVIGTRRGSYFDKATGETLPTQVESPIWRIMALERPEKGHAPDQPPVRVELVIGKQWEPLLTSAQLAQYLPLGEVLGSIPPNKVAGDWARSVGLVLAGLWRRRPREAEVGSVKPTRRELLTTYTPKTRAVEELLDTDKPRRAVEYWRDALGILVECGFIERTGEAALSVDEMLKPFGREGWQSDWLNAPVSITAGPKMQPSVSERAQALPPLKPKALQAKRRGRPRKKTPV